MQMEAPKIQKKYNCVHCAKICSSKSHLNYHLKTHSTTRYSCGQCGKSLQNPAVLRKHEKLHAKITPVECNECGKKFRSNFTLSAHIAAQHQNVFRFACDVCEKKYSRRSTLQQHMLKHYAKQFECGQCQKKFQRNSTLKLHQKRHSQTERFQCESCPCSFRDACALQRHSNIHKHVTSFKCTLCNTYTVRRDNMLRHVRNMHRGESFKTCVVERPVTPTNQQTSIESDSDRIDRSEINDTANVAMISQYNVPKTVANSSVIKCVGNVEPIQVPHLQYAQFERQRAPAPAINLREGTTDAVSKHYNPIELYRKILSTEVDEENSRDRCEAGVSEKEVAIIDSDFTKLRDYETATSTSTTMMLGTPSNFSATHWRKNFKYTYQYKDY